MQHSFKDLQRSQGTLDLAPGVLLVFDPGNTTGWSLWVHGELASSGHVLDIAGIRNLIDTTHPDVILFESYFIYAHKLDRHTHSDVPTLQLIGQIKLLADMYNIPYVTQTASQGKAFVTDSKLKAWGMHVKGVHARDAVRHGAHWLLFGLKPKQ